MLRKFGSHLRNQWIGTLALFLVLGGGTAYAVTQLDRDSVRSKHIVNDQVKTPDLMEGAVKAAQIADNAVNGNKVLDDSLGGADIDENSLGKVPNADTLDGNLGEVMWAVVKNDGTLVRSSSGVTCPVFIPGQPEPASCRPVQGLYIVTFPRSIVNCAWVASASSPDDADPGGGFVTGNVRNDGNGPVPNKIQIRTANPSGAATNLSFHLIVTCPPG